MESYRTASLLLLAYGLFPWPAAGRAGNGAPVPVSPGAAEHELAITAACPTFSWSQAAGARGYELSVFEVSELGWVSETPARSVELPPGTGSWTPSAESCLEPGRRYAWKVQELGSRDRAEESASLLFEVREPAEAASRVEALLRDLATHLGVEVEDLRGRLAGESADSAAARSPRLRAATDMERAEGPSREVAATTSITFSGNFAGRVHAQSGGGWWADLAGPGIGGTGPTGVTGWGQTGMFGYGDVTGVWGETGVPSGVAVRGIAWAGGLGLVGYSGGASYGVYGESTSGSGVYGTVVTATSSNAGVKGFSTNATGVRGESSAKAGVHGVGSPGVYGESGDNGVEGVSTGSNFASGVKGVAHDGLGVHGRSANGTAVYGVSDYGVGVLGSGGVYGGYFSGGDYGVFIDFGSGCYGCATKLADRASVATKEASPRLPARALLATASGAFLSNGGVWVNASDERVKENFAEVDGEDLLARVDRLPIRTWNYIADGPAVRHIGPTAQDFQAAFELGGADTAISTVDPAGIALATIQALHRANQEQQRVIEELRARLTAVERRQDPKEDRSTLLTP